MNEKTEKFDIIILAGQSNAEGNGLGKVRREFRPNDRIFILRDANRAAIYFDEKGILRVDEDLKNEIIPATETQTPDGGKIGNFSLAFAEEYLKNGFLADGRKLLIIYAAVGGTGFAKHQWGNTAVLQERAFAMLDYALSLNSENKAVALLWHQGEHDVYENADLSLKTKERYYYEKFGFFVKKIKEKCGDVPVIAGGFCAQWVNSGYTASANAVSAATKKVLKENGGSFVKTQDLLSNDQAVGNGDNIHFCRRSLYVLGKRYFRAFRKLVKK